MKNPLLFSFALLAALGCSSGTRSDPKPKTTEEPKTKTAKTEPAKTLSTAPAPATSAATAPIPEEPRSMVIFYSAYKNQLIPLACYDASTKSLLREDACLNLVPEGSVIAFPGAKTAKITGRTPYLCEPSGDEVTAFTSEGLSPDDAFQIGGIWPPSALDSFHVLPEPAVEKSVTLPEPERALLEKTVRTLKPTLKESLFVKQAVSLDLDGDGKEDKLYSVVASEGGGGGPSFGYEFSGLLYANGQTPEKLIMLESSDLNTFHVDGYTDLDGDKKQELWLSVDYYEGSADLIVRLEDDKLEDLGAWGCGA